MQLTATHLTGAFVVRLEDKRDDRGSFTRTFDAAEFRRHGLNDTIVQSNLSRNHCRGTLRGMHYQVAPAEETKLVRCSRGAVLDVIVDMRPGSSTYLKHFALELTAENGLCLYVPAMFAHGYQTLTDDAEVTYHVSAAYAPECERGVRYDDPLLGISWPLPVTAISAKDAAHPLLEREPA